MAQRAWGSASAEEAGESFPEGRVEVVGECASSTGGARPPWLPLLGTRTAGRREEPGDVHRGTTSHRGFCPTALRGSSATAPPTLPGADVGMWLLPMVLQRTLPHVSLTSDVSMAMGFDYIKCLDSNITGNFGQQPLHGGGKCWWVLALSKTTRRVTSSCLQPTVTSIPLAFQAWSPDCPSSLMCMWLPRVMAPSCIPALGDFQGQHWSRTPSTQPGAENRGRFSHVGGKGAFAYTWDALPPAPVAAVHLPFKVQSKGLLVWWLLHWWGAFPYCPPSTHG